jgi:alpha-galactosidase
MHFLSSFCLGRALNPRTMVALIGGWQRWFLPAVGTFVLSGILAACSASENGNESQIGGSSGPGGTISAGSNSSSGGSATGGSSTGAGGVGAGGTIGADTGLSNTGGSAAPPTMDASVRSPSEGGAGDATLDVTAEGGRVVDASFDVGSVMDARIDGAFVDASGPVSATPPMGWNSWNTFQCNINESLIKATVDAMVSSGMQAAGFQYVNIDDCWMDGRDASGNLRWNATKFPAGLPALADYVHGRGLKLGIYETPNTLTCVGVYGGGITPAMAVGSLGHEAQDARTFASWGIDYLKYDLCTGQRSSFAIMGDALRSTGRAIVYSINPGNGTGDLCPPNPTGAAGSLCGLDLPGVANLWRIGFDINASWASIVGLVDQDAMLSRYAGPGHWNDPDMLEVGNGTLTADENRSHLSMWAMLAAPLLAGNDLRSMSATTQSILTNAEVIAVDQDPLGVQGTLVATPQAGLQVWSKPLSGGNARAVALLNRNAAAAAITVSFAQVGLPNAPALVRDLWQRADLGSFNGSYTANAVPSHGVVMLRIVTP